MYGEIELPVNILSRVKKQKNREVISMDKHLFSKPLPLSAVRVTDAFWQREMELVRTEVIPYQWDALNDRIPDAERSWCMHNFRAAARLQARKMSGENGPAYTYRGFQVLPERGKEPDEDSFYGFVFQDTDFSKWVEAVGYSLMQHPDPELEKTADEAIDIVCAAQADDGYLDTYYLLSGMDKAFTNLKDHHELYCLGHLTEGAVAYYQATGKDKLLKAACRFADCVATHFGPEEGKMHGYPGHEIAEMALIRLYEVTGEERYLDLARYFVDTRGTLPHYFAEEEGKRTNRPASDFDPANYAYYQAAKPVREQDEAVGHAVRAMYLYSGMADVARQTEDEALMAACEKLWHSAVDEKRYITGGVGGTHMGEAFSFRYDLPNDSAYSETCAAIGLVFFARRMLQIKPDRRYGDVMEQALYNTVLAGMALDGKSFFYVNPLSVVPEACHRDERLRHVKPVRQKWFGCACCPPNIARLVSSVAAYAYTQSEDTLFTHLYVNGSAEATLNGKEIAVNVTSGLPWAGQVRVEVTADNAEGTLAFRMPGWADAPSAKSAGKQIEVRDGYAYVTGCWNTGDVITIELPMRVHVLAAKGQVREDSNLVAFVRGPITYCAEEADNGADLHLIHVHPERLGAACEQVKLSTDERLGHAMTVLTVPVTKEKVCEAAPLYADWQPAQEQAAELKLIPYYAWANRGEGEMRVWLHV